MRYNLKELVYEEEPIQEKVDLNINIPSFKDGLFNSPKEITSITTAGLNSRVGLLNGIVLELGSELSKLSNSDHLNAVIKLVTKKNLPETKISGYNYTNLGKSMTLKNPFIEIIDNFDEILGVINKIVNMNISDDEKKYKLSQISVGVGYDLTSFGFSKSDNIPQYYRNDLDNVVEIIITNYESVYKDLKSCKRYIPLFNGYIKTLNKYTDTMNKLVSGKEISDAYAKYDPTTSIGKEITRIMVEECKVLNSFSETFTSLITIQINEVKDSLKQDITILNNLVKEYQK